MVEKFKTINKLDSYFQEDMNGVRRLWVALECELFESGFMRYAISCYKYAPDKDDDNSLVCTDKYNDKETAEKAFKENQERHEKAKAARPKRKTA